MKLLLFLLSAAVSLVLSAAPEFADMPIRTDGVRLQKGRGDVVAKVSRVSEGGKEVVSLLYDFSHIAEKSQAFAKAWFGHHLDGMPQEFTLELCSDVPERELPLGLWLQDRSGEVYLMRFNFKGEGWRTVKIPMKRTPAWKSGDGNRKPDLPLSFMGIILHLPGENAKGTLKIGNVTVRTDLEALEISGYPSLEKCVAGGRRPALALNLTSRNKFSLADYRYSLRATDLYSGRRVLEINDSFKGMTQFPEKMALNVPYGQIQIEFEITRGGARVLEYQGDFTHLMPEGLSEDPAVRAWEYEYSPLGGVFGDYLSGDASIFGASWIRFEVPGWLENEISPGAYRFDDLYAVMRPLLKANIRPVILQHLKRHPAFQDLNDPARYSLGYGRHSLREAAALKGMTRYFELGNEDNGLTKFLYTEVARQGAAAIRSQQPFAVISNSGTAHIDHNWLEFQRSRGLFEYLDALCVHPYTNNSTPTQEVGPEKGLIYEKLTQLNDIVDAAGGMKQLWGTEYGWPNSSLPKGEHDRADLYVREMIVGDMAGLAINGLYTWNRDYGIVGRPAGAAVQTFSRMRMGRRFAGFYKDGGIWVAVYERGDNATAVVWTPEAETRPNPVRGGAYFDLFGNPLKENAVQISQSPVYIRDVEKAVLDRARANTVEIARQRLEKNTRHSAESGKGAVLCQSLEAWSRASGAISQQEQTVIARRLDHALAQARLDGSLSASKADFAARRAELEKKVLKANANQEDIPSVRYLLNLGAKLEAESKLLKKPVNPVNTMAKLVYDLADRFARDGHRVQYAVFGNLYMKQEDALKERLVFVNGRRTAVQARISSYAPEKMEALVRPVLPEGWKAFPESRKVMTDPANPVFADFQIECPLRSTRQNLLQLSVELPGRSAMVTSFNDLEIVPALTVEVNPISGVLPDTQLAFVIHNQESVPVSGEAVVSTSDGHQELARFKVSKLVPGKEMTIPLKFAKVTPAMTKDWRVLVRFKLDDGRDFSIPIDLDFVYATSVANPPKIDARFDEWSRALPLRLNKDKYTRGSYGNNWTAQDCSAVSMLMWDRDCLYFAAEVQDQAFNQRFTGDSTWLQDSIQIIFADAEERKPFQINLALTPEGAQAWGDYLLRDISRNRLLKEMNIAIEYRDGRICYEAAIPWSVFPGKLKDAVKKREFLYGIAVNDDDAVVPRRFLERFENSIVHGGKNVNSFSRVTLGGEPPDAEDSSIVFEEDFTSDTPGKTPLRWSLIRINLPKNAIQVVNAPGARDGKAVRLENRVGEKPNHYALITADLQLVPNAEYELIARVKNVPDGVNDVIGVCTDNWGNQGRSYAKLSPSPDWQEIRNSFSAPFTGNLKVIIRNAKNLLSGMLIDSIRIERKGNPGK